jgi:protein SCO1/2
MMSPSFRFIRALAVGSVVVLQAQHYTRSVHKYAPPSVRLLDTTGRPVRFDALLDTPDPVVLQFIFTSCTTICPILTATLAAAQDQFGPGVRLISISIDPENDTPARLAQYAARFRAHKDWIFLTGAQKDVTAVQRAFDAEDNGKMNHRPVTFLRAAAIGRWVRLEGLTSTAELVGEYHRAAAP